MSMATFWSFQCCTLVEVEYQPVGGIPIQVVPVQLLGPQEAQAFIQLQARRVCDFRLQDDLVCVAGGHGVDGHAD